MPAIRRRLVLLLPVLMLAVAGQAGAQEDSWRSGKLAHLVGLAGTYHLQEVLADPAVAAAIKKLVPAGARDLIPRNLDVAQPIDFISGYLVLSGNAPHAGGEDEAQVWLKVYDGSAIVLLTSGGVPTLYADVARYDYLPKMLRLELAHAPSDALSERPQTLDWYGKK